jgi:tetraacyldisaccharide 4'-kinase
MASTPNKLDRVWYGDTAPPLSWRLVESLYTGVTALRRRLYRNGILRTHRVAKPVVVVGNLTAGGTGKTPLTIALIDALRTRGLRAGVVSRGYGGSERGPLLVDHATNPAQVGDEPLLIHLRTHAPVAIGRDRVAAAQLLLDNTDVDVVIADDGLQHYRLHRDVEICVVDGARRFGNARLLPAGPLREPLARLAGIDFVVVNGGEPHDGEVPMRLVNDGAYRVDDPLFRAELAAFAGERVHAVAGIGNPARFFDGLRALGIDPVEHPFPDHHAYVAGDLAFGDDAPVLMTEKDAVKCRAVAPTHWWALPIAAQLPAAFYDALAARITASP